MIHEQDFVDLAKDCSNLCDMLMTGTRGKKTDSLSSPVKEAIEYLNKLVRPPE